MYKTQVQMDQNVNIKPTTLNLIEEKGGSTLEFIGTGDHFLNITPVSQTLRETINKWDLLKLRSFCKAKDNVNKKNDSLQNGKRSSPILLWTKD